MLFVYEYCLMCYNKCLIFLSKQEKRTCQYVRHTSVSNTILRHKGPFWSIMFPLSTHICRIKGCGGAGCPPPPIIFERLKLPQQIIYRRKENLSESPNHQKYWENILVSRFYEQFSRNRRNLGHFRKFEKISNS